MKKIIILLLLLIFSSAHAEEAKIVPESRQQINMSFAPLVKRTAPAVVNIFTKRTEKIASPLFQDPMFQLFYDRMQGGVDAPRERVVRSLGSGVIVRKDGYIITNSHVIEGSDQIRVVLSDRREFDAEISVQDKKTDLALLKIKDASVDLPYLELGDSDRLEVGDIVLAIGNPFGIGQTVTSGIVSALARTTVGISDFQFFIQTDAAINPGNSGGALVSADGKLVGVNTAIFSKTGASNGIGFATPANMVKTVLGSIGRKGKIVRPWFGAGVESVTSEVAQALGLNRPVGALIKKVMPGSPVAKAGLKTGDVILQMDGNEIQDSGALKYRIATYAPGAKASVVYWRYGEQKNTEIVLEEPSYMPAPDFKLFVGNNPLTGVTVANLSPGLANDIGIDVSATGVVILDVQGGKIASRLGLTAGDIILLVNNQNITDTESLEKAMRVKNNYWKFVISRDGKKLSFEVRL